MGNDELSEEDKRLFRQTVGVVRHLEDDRTTPHRKSPVNRPRASPNKLSDSIHDMLSDADYEREIGPEEVLSYARSGVSGKTLRQLRRGHFRIQAEVDLHGMTVTSAQQALSEFFHEARIFQWRCVRIVHGKGFGSVGGRPVIKSKLARWLQLRSEVLAFVSARPVDGGTGAVYVLLKY